VPLFDSGFRNGDAVPGPTDEAGPGTAEQAERRGSGTPAQAVGAAVGRLRVALAAEVAGRANHDGRSLPDPDDRLLKACVTTLLGGDFDADVIALFDTLLRHPNYHVPWDLLKNPPADERLIPGMFSVVDRTWAWQAETAGTWLEQFAGTPAYEAARTQN